MITTRWWISLSVAMAVTVAAICWWWQPGPPSSQDAFQLMMATYSAARSEDSDRIEMIESHLDRLLISDDEAEPIRAVLQIARQGAWDHAADEAYLWMQQQRRRARRDG